MIEIIDLHKSFGDHHVLRGASLQIKSGENMVVIGGSGTGKSVLIKHVIGLLHPDEGKVLVENEDVASLKEKRLTEFRKKFGMLFQGAALFDSLTVGENVGFALAEHSSLTRKDIEKKVKEKLAVVGLAGIEHLKPAELSGGMKKRVGLARAIAIEPQILLYDEPTTGLDPIMADVINDLIIDMRDKLGMTSITITHDMISACKIADRIAMLLNGRIVFVGTPEEIRRSDNPDVKKFVSLGLKGENI